MIKITKKIDIPNVSATPSTDFYKIVLSSAIFNLMSLEGLFKASNCS
jgi:hypothetical protein